MNNNIEQHLKQIEQIENALGMLSLSVPHNDPTLVKAITSLEAIRTDLQAQAEQGRHEGWSNYETWACYSKTGYILIADNAKPSQLISCIKRQFERRQQELTDRINFTEIAEMLIVEAKTEEKEEYVPGQ